MSRTVRALGRPTPVSRAAALVVAAGAVIAAGLSAGCGGKVVLDTGSGASSGTGPAPVAACTLTTGGVMICEALVNAGTMDPSSFNQACTSGGGMVVTECPTDNLLGSCTISAGGITVEEVFYAGGGLTAATAQQACTSGGGTWSGP